MSQEVIKIRGGQPLKGEVTISGAKNSAVAIIPATLLAQGQVKIDGLPQISDVETLVSLLEDLNIKTNLNGKTLEVDTTDIKNAPLPNNKVESLRASYYMMGAMLGRFKKCVIGLPGGCPLGPRPIDQHIKGFKALGAEIDESSDTSMKIEAKELHGANIFLDMVSVGATINIMLAAVHAKGQTTIENAAKEPEVVDVANFLNSLGANIKGAGTSTLKISGVAAACGDEVTIKNIVPKHLEALTVKLNELGVDIDIDDDKEQIVIKGKSSYKNVDIKTLVYPGFATDLQQPITPLLFMTDGPSFVTETIYPARFRHVEELKNMGASIEADTSTGTATIKPSKLQGAKVYASAGLLAEGVTTIYNVKHIYRGYTDIVKHLKDLGADIWTEQV